MTSLSSSPPKLPRPPQRPPACRACKRRKSKCDFEQPCSTCMLHNTVDCCQYDTMAVPRERRSTTRPSPTGPSSRTSDMKNLKLRLGEAEKTILAQRKEIELLQAVVRVGPKPSPRLAFVSPGGAGMRPGEAARESREDEREDEVGRGAEESEPAMSDGLADEMTRLVIGSAIAPTNASPPSVAAPEIPGPRPADLGGSPPDRGAAGDARQLRISVLNLLASHNNSSLEDLARTVGLAPPPPNAAAPAGHAIVATTILPAAETITSVHGLMALFPPRKADALALLDTYLAFVNLVHHVVDGPQTRHELELFYDLLIHPHPSAEPSAKPSPMPVPALLEPGWLSAMLAIFVLADKSDRGGLLRPRPSHTLPDAHHPADDRCKRWLEGSLQGLRMRLSGESVLDLSALRSVCLVVWIYVLYGQDDEVLPAVNLNSMALYRACHQLQLHRDPSRLSPGLSAREAEDRRRIFYNLINTDWLFSAIAGKTFSPVAVDGHDVRPPRPLGDRDPIPPAISGLAFRSLLMRQLRSLATLALGPGGISQADAAKFENELDALDGRLPGWCEIDVDNFQAGRYIGDPQAQAAFSQQIITNVQLCAVRVRFHTKFASPGPDAPSWMREGASHHRSICISRAVRLLRLEQLHLKYATRILGHSGYPRFHPIVGGLTLSALMAKSSDPVERAMLFDELTKFTRVIDSYGTLSQVTNFGILAIETALAEVRRGSLLDGCRRPHSAVHKEDKGARAGEGVYSPLVAAPGPFDGALGLALNAEPPLRSRTNAHHFRPTPIMIPQAVHPAGRAALKHSTDLGQHGAAAYELPVAQNLGGGGLAEPEPYLLTANTLSPSTAASTEFGQLNQVHDPQPLSGAAIESLFSGFGGLAGMSYEGLMVEWMGASAAAAPAIAGGGAPGAGAGIETCFMRAGGVVGNGATGVVGNSRNANGDCSGRPGGGCTGDGGVAGAGGYTNGGEQLIVPTLQNTWRQEW